MLYFVVNNKIEKTIDISAIGKNMFTCMEDDEENLWGCVDGFDGVVKISRDFVLKPYGKDKGLNNKLIVVKQRSDGTIFGGGGTDNNYLYQYNKTEDKFYNLSRKLNFITNNDIYINDIAFYSNIIWLATTHGVLKYDSVKTERLNLGDYTERNTFSIAAENSGALWFSNGKGVMKYANNQAVLFDDNNGLSNLTATYRCLAIDSLNRIWLGTSLGVNFSENLAQTQSTPLPIITNIYVNNSKIKDLTGQIKYTKGSFLTLNFFSLSFPGNEISYQYKLSAENSNWIDIQSKTELILPNLPVGKHSFEIRAKQQGNYQWSEGTRLEILIIRPWFMRWWAYVLYFIVLNLVIYVIVKINSNRLEAQKLHLEQLVKERTNEVVAQKNEILGKNEVLQQNMEELRTLNENVEEQKNIIAKTNLRLQLQATELSEKNTTLEQFNYQLKKYYTVLEQSPAAVLITDINGTIEYVNPFFTKLTGYTTDEVIGKNPRILKSKETPNEVFTDLWSTILSGKIWEGTITNRKKDKSLIVEKVIIAPIFDNNTIVNFVAIKNDVTELIRAEKLILESLETTQKQKVIIEKAHKNIVNSINYGKTIQDALLTSKKLIDQYLSEYFLLFKPKETVSGDFYYINKISDTLIFAVADCTGHGVSGGFMTMLGITYIHEIVRQTEISDANRVLSVLRDRFKNTFKTFGTENRNGMDINFCTVNLKTNVLQYAGAYNPLFIIRNGELTEYEATRAPIGFYPVEIEFKNNEIQLYDNDLIYLFSDGYQDQLGGDNSRKFTKKQFKQKLIDVSSEPLSIQFQIIEDDLKNWQKERAQTDDITVLGLKWKTQSIHEIKA